MTAARELPGGRGSVASANPIDEIPRGRCQFNLTAPRHFLYPALLLLLAEEPRHGYALVEALNEIGLGRIDRPSVYRALGDLEVDGLVLSWDERAPTAGSTRHVYAITPAGERALEAWMSVVAEERSCLDLVLQRYWYCNARRFPELGAIEVDDVVAKSLAEAAECDPTGASPNDRAGVVRTRFKVGARSSSIVVEARSNIGPIAFGTGIAGEIEVGLENGFVTEDPPPVAHLAVDVGTLSSGNVLYDKELHRRIEVRRFPEVLLDLHGIQRMGEGNCYQLFGEVTIHGVAQRLVGIVTATILSSTTLPRGSGIGPILLIAGEYVLDIRQFDMEVPKMALLKIYPDVRLHLRLEATALPDDPGARRATPLKH